ncbi:MAG: hypothetical protein RMK02_08205 [Burkholderiales bacterium]|nr:hypothetical protein [Burkholderiales bacterium]
MSTASRALVLSLAWALSAGLTLSAEAKLKGVRLDDSGTVAAPLRLQWSTTRTLNRSSAPDRSAFVMEASGEVQIRINTSPYAGRSGRILLALAPDAPSGLTVEWQSLGRLASGQLQPGGRALVYTGALPEEGFSERWKLRLTAQPNWSRAQYDLEFRFEFDED